MVGFVHLRQLLPGRFPIHDLPDIGVDLPEGEYATIAGLVLDQLGRIPNVADTLVVDGWTIEVHAVRGRTVGELALHRAPLPAELNPSLIGTGTATTRIINPDGEQGTAT